MTIRAAKILLLILASSLFTGHDSLFAQEQGTVQKVTGKVELKAPGMTWVSASPGMKISKGTIISTGFKSALSLDLGDSELEVKQLTRLTLEELIKQEGKVTTALSLKVGKVNAKVKTAEGLQHDFTLRSTTSTASVRGTELDFDGFTIVVSEGTVEFLDATGTREFVFQGESSGGEDALNVRFGVSPYTSEGGVELEFPDEGSGTIIIVAN